MSSGVDLPWFTDWVAPLCPDCGKPMRVKMYEAESGAVPKMIQAEFVCIELGPHPQFIREIRFAAPDVVQAVAEYPYIDSRYSSRGVPL